MFIVKNFKIKISGLVPFLHSALDISDQRIISLILSLHSGPYPNEEFCLEVAKFVVMRVGPLRGRVGFSGDKTHMSSPLGLKELSALFQFKIFTKDVIF